MSNLPAGAINHPFAPWNGEINDNKLVCTRCDEYTGKDNYNGFCGIKCHDLYNDEQETLQDELKYSIRLLFDEIDWQTEPILNLTKMLCDKAVSMGFNDLADEMQSDSVEMLKSYNL